MTVAPLIAMKSTKCESLEAVGKELDRRAHTYANDVDQSGRHVGYLCRAGDVRRPQIWLPQGCTINVLIIYVL
jgi:hypothetical protein